MSLAKDQSLTVVISGKPEDVMKARREVVSELQTQVSAPPFKDLWYLTSFMKKFENWLLF